MLVDTDECMSILRCPRTGEALSRTGDVLVSQQHNGHKFEYPILHGTPVLIDFSKSVLDEDRTIRNSASSVIERKTYHGPMRFIKHLLSPRKKSTRGNVGKLVGLLREGKKPARVLVVGGGSIGQGMDPLYDDPSIHVYGFDIYASPYVQFVADAHQIPLPDEYFDAIVVQAVLEHVLQPAEVVAEIWRVLKFGGLVYAETPFMQQVHEGAFDFTRYTDSGHRYLFRRFDLISSGASGGPGLQFMWSVDYLARGVFRSRWAGSAAKLAFFWTQYLDRIIPDEYQVDGASGVYFLGRKSREIVPPQAMVGYYKGAQARHD